MLVYSATRSKLAAADVNPHYFLTRQAAYVVVGVVFMVVLAALDYRWLEHASAVLYVAMILALLAMFSGIGSSALGATRWIQIGPVQIQPSAFATLVLIVTVATFCARRPEGLGRNDMLKVLALAAVPILLVVKQPDLGSGIVMSVVLLVMLVIAGIPNRYLVLLVLLAVTGAFALVHFKLLKGYQLTRITSVFHIGQEPPEHRIQRGPVGGGHRVGRLVGDGVVPRTADQPGLCARAADRLHLLGVGRAARLRGRGRRPGAARGPVVAAAAQRPAGPRRLRPAPGRRVLHAGGVQCVRERRDGHGDHARGRDPPAVPVLRRVGDRGLLRGDRHRARRCNCAAQR